MENDKQNCWDSDSEIEDAEEVEFELFSGVPTIVPKTETKKPTNNPVQKQDDESEKKTTKRKRNKDEKPKTPKKKKKKPVQKDDDVVETLDKKKTKRKRDDAKVDEKIAETTKQKKKKKEIEKFHPVQQDEWEYEEEDIPGKLAEIRSGLSFDQNQALDMALSGNNLFITGAAGTGKSKVIKAIYESLKLYKKSVHVTAYTGVAASNLSLFGIPGVTTLHSWMGTRKIKSQEDINRVIEHIAPKRTQTPVYFNQWFTDVLIIDECSMILPSDLNALEKISRSVRNEPNLHFGGLQVIAVGDFFQLEPVWSKDEIEKQKKLQLSGSSDSFASMCFQLKLWESVFPKSKTIVLKQNYRQNQDAQYAEICDKIREGLVDASVVTALLSRVNVVLPVGQAVTRLVARNKKAAEINAEALSEIVDQDTVSYQMHIKTVNVSEEEKTNLMRSVTEMGLLSELLELKVGAAVILRRNIDTQRGLSNGSQGVVIRFQTSLVFPDVQIPVILFNNGLEEAIDFHTYRKYVMKRVLVPDQDKKKKKKKYTTEPNLDKFIDVVQLPLALAFAITIHKAQSLTLDNVHVDIDDKMFANGQTYIALSRVRKLENLYLGSFNQASVKVNKLVVEYYRSLNALLFPHLDGHRKYGKVLFERPSLENPNDKQSATKAPKKDLLDLLEENLLAQQQKLLQDPPVVKTEPRQLKEEESSSSGEDDSDDSSDEDSEDESELDDECPI